MVDEGGAGGVGVVGGSIGSGEGGESVALTGRDFTALVEEDWGECELEVEFGRQVKTDFKICEGGGEVFTRVMHVEAGSS